MQTSLSDQAGHSDEVRDALLKALDSSDAIRRLYLHFKEENRKFSLPFICRQAGIPSSGYLSDVMSGKRRLNPKYKASLVKVFKLTRAQGAYLRVLVDIDNERKAEKIAALREKQAVLAKALNVTFQRATKDLHRLFFALEVFCAFGLFRNQPTAAELRDYFKGRDVDAALGALKELKLVQDHTTLPGRYELLTEQIVFGGDDQGLSHFDFLRLGLAHASEHMERWFPDRTKSHFESSILSVKREHFETVLPEFKSRLLILRSELESNEADMLIRMNVQLYPI